MSRKFAGRPWIEVISAVIGSALLTMQAYNQAVLAFLCNGPGDYSFTHQSDCVDAYGDSPRFYLILAVIGAGLTLVALTLAFFKLIRGSPSAGSQS